MLLLTLLEGFLLLTLLSILFMIVLRYLAPVLIRLIFRRLSKKMEEECGESYAMFKGNSKGRPFKPSATEAKKNDDTLGEYVDFEEID